MSRNWPADVSPIAVTDLDRLGINRQNQLFWDGERIEVRQRLELTGAQRVLAGIVTVCAVLGGIDGFATGLKDASEFLCRRNIHAWCETGATMSPAAHGGGASLSAPAAR